MMTSRKRAGLSVGLALIAAVTAVAASENPFSAPATPKDNPTTPAKAKLGKALYFDNRLSINNSLSCNSCHDATGAGHDGKQFSPGHAGKLGGRNSPTVLNAAYMSVQFWDGRAATLEDQAKGPLTNPIEMGMPNHDLVVERVSKIAGYRPLFDDAFGKGSKITIDTIAKAIASYERTLITPGSAYDRFIAGDKAALNDAAKRGLNLVQTAGCLGCHSGPHFAGPAMPLGTGFYQKFPLIPGSDYDKKYQFSADLGRFEVTKSEADKNMFRVPTWRNVALTAPYFHNGSVKTLDEAIRVMGKTQLGKDFTTAEVKDIEAFLVSLNGKPLNEKAPVLPQ